MGFTENVMQNLSYNIKELNNNMDILLGLQQEIKRSNDLREIELGLRIGNFTKEEAKVRLELIINEQQNVKGKQKNKK